MIEEAYKYYEKKLYEKLGEDWDGSFDEFEMQQQNIAFAEMTLKFPEVSVDDITEYQETKNWT